MPYTIKDLEEKTKVSAHTLRYWAKRGLFPNIMRDGNNYRLFEERDILWVTTVRCLRETGMSIPKVLDYLKLCEEGEKTLKNRIQILKAQKKEIEATLETYQNALCHIEKKLATMEGKTNATCPKPQNEDYQALKNHSLLKKQIKK